MRCNVIRVICAVMLCTLFQGTQLHANDHTIAYQSEQVDVTQFLLCPPRFLSGEEIISGLHERNLDMTWNIGDADHFRFVTHHDEIYFEIFLSAFPDCFEETQKKLFTEEERQIEGITKKIFTFSYRLNDFKGEVINGPNEDPSYPHADGVPYTVAERRILKNTEPQEMTASELAEIISIKNIVFYTGAGLSAASNVPTMSQLFDLLKLEEGYGFFSIVKKYAHGAQRSSQQHS